MKRDSTWDNDKRLADIHKASFILQRKYIIFQTALLFFQSHWKVPNIITFSMYHYLQRCFSTLRASRRFIWSLKTYLSDMLLSKHSVYINDFALRRKMLYCTSHHWLHERKIKSLEDKTWNWINAYILQLCTHKPGKALTNINNF